MQLQSGKWTRKQIIMGVCVCVRGGGVCAIFISLQKSEKTISEMGGIQAEEVV